MEVKCFFEKWYVLFLVNAVTIEQKSPANTVASFFNRVLDETKMKSMFDEVYTKRVVMADTLPTSTTNT